MTRTEQREILMQAIFQMEAQADNDVKLFERFLESKNIDKTNEEAFTYLKNGYNAFVLHKKEIDEKIDKFAKSRDTKRMAKIDLAILRVSVYEIFYSDTPAPVVINEAVEMAKKYSDVDGSKFVNGVLGSIERSKK